LWSKVHFNETTADFRFELWNRDIEELTARFTDANTGEVAVKFEARAIVPGSTKQGVTGADGDIVTREFKVIVVDNTLVETCSTNSLSISDTSYMQPDITRDSEYTHTVPASTAAAALELQIPARKIVASATGCEIVTELEVFYPDFASAGTGEWRAVRSNEYHTQYLTVAEGMYVSFAPTQPQFIEEIAPDFAWDTSVTPV
jgi:hypothetical protein